MKNDIFEIDIHRMTGGIERLTKVGDNNFFNWIQGRFGMPFGMNFLDKTEILEGIVRQTYAYFSYLDLYVERELTEEGLKEKYTFKNTGDKEMVFTEGELGIYATFADSLDIAEVAKNRRAHSHIWCGAYSSYIYNAKMNGAEDGVGLVLTKGALSRHTEEDGNSGKRGDVVLRLPAITLDEGETYELEWLVFPYENKQQFFDIIESKGALLIEASNFFPSIGDNIIIRAKADKASLNGAEFAFDNNIAEVPILFEGEQQINISYGEKHTFIRVFAGEYVSADTDKIIEYYGVKKCLSKKSSAKPLLEARKNVDWYKKIGDRGYLALASVELFRYYRIYKAENIADIGIPIVFFKDNQELLGQFKNQVINAISLTGRYGFYKELAAFDMLKYAYSIWNEEGYYIAAQSSEKRLLSWLGIQPDYRLFKRPDLYKNNEISASIGELTQQYI
ncbi:MAG: hypothetical protein EOM87_03370 [Clostridia bacterium]|nr:hypothetical protein [Clostridia bacterium]